MYQLLVLDIDDTLTLSPYDVPAENLAAIRAFVGDDAWEQLSYNTLAPAKYASVGREYRYSLPKA